MKGQLAKDLYLRRKDLILLVIVYLATIAFTVVLRIADPVSYSEIDPAGRIFVIAYSILLTPVILSYTFFNDEKCGHQLYTFITPITRKEYVSAKYLFASINVALCAVLMFAFLFIAAAISEKGITSDGMKKIFLFIGIMLAIEILANTLIISVSVKEGAQVAVIILCVLALILGAVFPMEITFVLDYAREKNSPQLVTAYIIVETVLILGVEIWLFIMSYKWAEKKEV